MDQTAPKTGPARWIKLLVVLVMLLLLVLGAALWLLPGSSQVQRKLDAIRKAGYPVTPLDLARSYPPLPAEKNSIVIYQKAFSKYVRPPSTHTNWPVLSKSGMQFRSVALPPDIKEGIAGFIAQNQATLALLHQAAATENGWIDHGFTNSFPPMTLGQFIISAHENAQLLAISAILQADNHESGPAAETILDLLGLPRSLKHDPLLTSQMIRNAVLHLSSATLEFALNRTVFSNADLQRLQAAFAASQTSASFKSSIACERCTGIWLHGLITANPFGRPGEPMKAKFGDLYFRIRYHREGEFITYLDLAQRYINVVDMPYPQQLEAAKKLNVEATQFESNSIAYGLAIPNWVSAYENNSSTFAQLSLAQTALAIERYRLAHQDQLPGTLQELVPAFLPAVPTDPFDGKPLRYNRLPKGYLIYSIGEDGVDNGGAEWNEDTKTGDITFTVER